MTIGKKVKGFLKNGKFVPAKTQVPLTPGQSLKVLRELQELSQNNIGVERAKVLAQALKVHPAVIVFPGWEVGHAS